MKFYHFRQNNSGGSFVIDENVNVNVLIEANDADEANDLAYQHGIYFDGCASGYDCDCCGDRWSSVDEHDGQDFPHHYGSPIDKDEMKETVIHYYNK